MHDVPHPASVTKTAFNCLHCGAYTTHDWYVLAAKLIAEGPRTPSLATERERDLFVADQNTDEPRRKRILDYIDRLLAGEIVISKGEAYCSVGVGNLWLSSCFNCKRPSAWVRDKPIFPAMRSGVAPNPDLPEELIRDFEEARAIVNHSPRGAAALLRLVVQKLCAVLGEKGKNINDDIASLVKKGLNPMVQHSLDAVRVIGNEAVHPGTLNVADDRDSALELFQLVNLIVDQMITHPKRAREAYEKLPPEKRLAIEERDAKGAGSLPHKGGGAT